MAVGEHESGISRQADAPPPDPAPSTLSDESLLRRLQSGDGGRAAEALHRRYAARVLAVARSNMSRGLNRRLDADDIAQSVFRRFFTAAKAGRYDLPGGAELWDLLVVITLNRLRSAELHHRAGKRDLRATAEFGEGGDPPAPSGGDGPLERLLAQGVEDAVAGLSEPGRTVVRLRLAGLEVGEIADATGRAKRTVERLLQETRTQLRRRLKLDDPR